jgi:uncharacterized membrane protein YhaH (DUF805 family)
MNWFLIVVRDNYANFSGRARRSEFWYFHLISFVISIILSLIDLAIGYRIDIIGTLYSIIVLIPGLAVSVRRLHDVGKSGWYYLLVLLPVIGWIWLLILFFTEGDNGPNEYGPDPKNPYEDINEIGAPQEY